MSEAHVTRAGEGEQLSVTGGSVRFLCPERSTGRGWSLMEAVLPRGAGPTPHEHPWDEGYFVVEGELRFVLGDRELTAKSGDFLYAPAGVVHAFQGASDTPARVLVVDVPAAAEAFFRDVDREVKDFPRDAHKLLEIGARHRMRFLRPG